MTGTAEAYGVWPVVRQGEAENGDAAPANDSASANDFALAQRAADGDMAAFEEIYRQQHRRVYSLCLRMTCNVSEAEDLTQEVFILLFHKIGGFRGEATLTTWLHRLTVNKVLMHFRRKKARGRYVAEDAEPGERAAGEAEGPRRTPVLDRIALGDALAKLSPGYRLVFILHDIEGYEHEEIARLLGCAAGTSKSQLHKARKRLRELLGARKT